MELRFIALLLHLMGVMAVGLRTVNRAAYEEYVKLHREVEEALANKAPLGAEALAAFVDRAEKLAATVKDTIVKAEQGVAAAMDPQKSGSGRNKPPPKVEDTPPPPPPEEQQQQQQSPQDPPAGSEQQADQSGSSETNNSEQEQSSSETNEGGSSDAS
jgi:Mg-chelatase subunit ChlI